MLKWIYLQRKTKTIKLFCFISYWKQKNQVCRQLAGLRSQMDRIFYVYKLAVYLFLMLTKIFFFLFAFACSCQTFWSWGSSFQVLQPYGFFKTFNNFQKKLKYSLDLKTYWFKVCVLRLFKVSVTKLHKFCVYSQYSHFKFGTVFSCDSWLYSISCSVPGWNIIHTPLR